MSNKLDRYDEKILFELDRNSRVSTAVMAKKAGLSKEAILYRIKKLTTTKQIKYFYSIINASRIGYNYTWILMSFQNISAEQQKKVIEYIVQSPNTANIRIMEGIFDIAFLTTHKNNGALKKFLQDLTKDFGEHLADKKISYVLKSYKFGLNKSPDEPSIRIILPHSDVQTTDVDQLDIKIIKVLSSRARIKILDLARAVKADPGTVRYHIKRMEKEGIIAGYSMALDLKKFRNEFHQINISLRDYDSVHKILEFFDRTGSCLYAYELLGKYDLSIDLYLKDVYELRRVLEEFKEKFSQEYIYYDVSHIINEHDVNWSPFG